MRICLLYPDYPPVYPEGVGDAKYVEKLGKSLAGQDVEVSVLTSSRQKQEGAYPPRENITVYPCVRSWGFRNLISNLRRLRSLICSVRPDAINIIYPATRLGSGYLIPYFIKIVAGRIPVVTTLFHFFPKNSNFLYKCMAPLLYFSSAKIHFHDDCLMNIFNSVFPYLRKKTFFVPVGTLTEVNDTHSQMSKAELKRSLNLDPESDYISFVGYWYPGKGVDVLLSILDTLKRKGRKMKLLLIGGHSKEDMSDYEEKMLRLIDDMGLRDEVYVTGHCPDKKVIDYLRCSDMAVFPFKSNKMIMGRSSIMLPIALGLPIVVTRPARQSAYLHDGDNVLMAPPGDVNAFANAIESLLDNEALRTSLGFNLRKLADTTSWDNISHQWLNVYRKIYA